MYTEAEKNRIRKDFTDKFSNTEVITAMPTPMLPPRNKDLNGTVDYEAAELLVRRLQKQGADGILIGGSTGEEAMMSREEKRLLVKTVRKEITSRSGQRTMKLLVGTGCTSTKETIEETKWAARIGADAALVIVPPQVKPNNDGQIFHFSAVAKAVPDLPIIIYNIPSRTGVNMKPEIVAEIAQRNPNVIGIKQSFADMEQVKQLKTLCPKDFLIYSGDDDLTLEMLKRGAHGVISVASNIDNATIKRMVVAQKSGRPKEANQLNYILTPLYKACFVTTNPIPVKHLLAEHIAPWMTSTLRPPMTPMNPQDHEKMNELYEVYLENKNPAMMLLLMRDTQHV